MLISTEVDEKYNLVLDFQLQRQRLSLTSATEAGCPELKRRDNAVSVYADNIVTSLVFFGIKG